MGMFRSPGAIAFHVGPLTIRWYGVLMATAILVGFWLADRAAKREGVSADKLLNAGQWAIIAGLVGARIYEVIFNWDYYGQHPWKIPAVWEGGLAIHGGLIAGILTGLWVARREGLPIRRSLDIVAPSIAIGQAIGRWGNFFNEEAFGTPTDLPWKLYISPQNRPLQYAGNEYFHPTFLPVQAKRRPPSASAMPTRLASWGTRKEPTQKLSTRIDSIRKRPTE